MTPEAAMTLKVFYEPALAPHPAELYAHGRVGDAIAAAACASDGALQRYRDDGFIAVRGLLEAEALAAGGLALETMARADRPRCGAVWYEGALREHLALSPDADRAIDGVNFTPGQEGDALPPLPPATRARYVRKFMGFVGQEAALTRLAEHPAILDLARQLLGAEPELFQDMALVKPPGGREKPWHQDHAYFNVALDTPIVGVWIPFGTVTPENGCMHLLAGSHRDGPRPHFKQRDWQLCDTAVEEGARVAVPMRAGDVLFFDGKVAHGTPTNRTGEHRWAVQFHYRPRATSAVSDELRLAAFGADGRGVTC